MAVFDTYHGYSVLCRLRYPAISSGFQCALSFSMMNLFSCGYASILANSSRRIRLRKRMRRLEVAKIEAYPQLKRFIIEKLKAHWNPDEIAGYLKRHRTEYPWYVSKTAIYEWLRTSRGERYCIHLYSTRRRVKRRKGKKTKRVMIPNRVDISRRNAGAKFRGEFTPQILAR